MNLRLPSIQVLRQNEAVLILVITTAITMLGNGIIAPILPLYAQSFGVDIFMIGLMVGAYGVSRIFMDIPAGKMVDRFGRRPMIVTGALLMALSSLGSALAFNFWILVGLRLVQGAGSAIYITTAQTAMADIGTSGGTRGQLLSLNQGSIQVGNTFGPAAGGFLAQYFGLRAPFFAFAGLALLAAAWAYLRIPETSRIRPAAPKSEDRQSKTTTVPRHSTSVTKLLLMDVSFLMVALMAVNSFMSASGIQQTMVPLYGTHYLGLTEGQLGLAMSAIGIGNLLTSFMAGWLSDRIGRKATIVPGVVLMGLSTAMVGISGNVFVFVTAAALMGIARGFAASVPAAYAADIAPNGNYGATLGLFRTFGDVGFVIGPLLTGWIADTTGSLSLPLFAVAAIMLVSALLFGLFARETVTRRA